jgi:predicted nucleotidyltransferase
MNDGLTDTQRQSVIDVLAVHPQVHRVVLFGSRAQGKFTVKSDIDLALFGAALTLDDQAQLLDKIGALPIPQRVDLLLYERITNEALRAQIDQSGVEWFRRTASR